MLHFKYWRMRNGRDHIGTIVRIAAICAVLVAGLSPAGAAAPGQHATHWPQYRGGPAHTGVAHEHLPDTLELRWTFKTEGSVRSSPVIEDGRVFIGSDDGNVYALDLASGRKLWTFATADSVQAPPTVLSGTVFVESTDAFLYALTAERGTLIWKYETGDSIMGAPNWVRSPQSDQLWILVGSYDNLLHCVDTATGKRVWTYEANNYLNGSPAVSGDWIVFGGCDAFLHVLSATDGKGLKTIDTGSYIAATVALSGNQAFVGHYGNQFLCADVARGKILWTYKDREYPFFSSAAVGEHHVVVGSRDKRLHCLRRKDGKQRWVFQARGKIDSSPVICGEKIVVGSDDGRLYVISLADGQELWSYEIGEPVSGSPAVAGGMIVIGCEDGSIYAFGEKR